MIGCFHKSREIIRESVFEQNKKKHRDQNLTTG